MRAVVYDRYGGPDVLRVDDVAAPALGDHDLLVRVRATSVNSWDCDLMRGTPLLTRLGSGVRRPTRRILGIDVAGVVEATGPGVTLFAPGDAVIADVSAAGFGAFAEFVAVPESVPAPKSPAMSFTQAAALPHAGVLALQAIGRKEGLGPGDRVLVNGAGGGVGTIGMQILSSLGLDVTGVDSKEKADTMRLAGADHVIDYRRVDFTRTGERYDLIIDVTARRSVPSYRRALSPGGVCVLVGGALGMLAMTAAASPLGSRSGGKRTVVLMHRPNPGDLGRLDDLVEAGTVTPVIDSVHGLEDIATAMGIVDRGEARGKVIVTV
jgi:NADPH:quinone reductase-like Zn-dependent oxidoreductase